MNIISTQLPFKGVMTSYIGGRKENQDTCGYSETPRGLLLVVCDGMGGGPGGKTASSIAATTIINYIKQVQALPDNETLTNEQLVLNAVKAANKALRDKIIEVPELNGMGTTVTVVLLAPDGATVAHVGDSRIYQLRQRKIVFRTADHSRVGEMVRAGVLTEEQARLSAISNLITRALAIGDEVEVDVCTLPYQKGDRFVLCTDGVWGSMPQDDLVKSFCDNNTIENIVEILNLKVEQAGRDKGGHHDNYTMIMVDTENASTAGETVPPVKVDLMDSKSRPEQTQPETPRRRLDSRMLALIITGIIITPVIIFLLFSFNKKTDTPILPPDPNDSTNIVAPQDTTSCSEPIIDGTDKTVTPTTDSKATTENKKTEQTTNKDNAQQAVANESAIQKKDSVTASNVSVGTALNTQEFAAHQDTLRTVIEKLTALKANIEGMKRNAGQTSSTAKRNYNDQQKAATKILDDLKNKYGKIFTPEDSDLLFRALLGRDARKDGNKPNGVIGIIGNKEPDFDRMLRNIETVTNNLKSQLNQN